VEAVDSLELVSGGAKAGQDYDQQNPKPQEQSPPYGMDEHQWVVEVPKASTQ
jgi:hypothetical protein